MPVYNAEKYVERCIKSILNQTIQNFEIIIVNDGSTDLSPVICDEYASKDDRIRVIHKENEGVSVARNTALDIAKGKYIEFVDVDDFLDESTLEILYNNAERNNSDVVVFGINKLVIRNEKILSFKKVNVKPGVFDLKSFMIFYDVYMPNAIIGASWNKLYRKSLLDGYNIRYDENLKNNEDTFFNYLVFEKCDTISVESNVFYNYVDENSNSASKKHKNFFEVYKKTYIRAIEFLENTDSLHNNICFQNTYFLNLIVDVLYNIVSHNKRPYKEKISDLRDKINDNIVKEALKNYNSPRVDKKFMFYLMKKNHYILLYIFAKMRERIKRVISNCHLAVK